MSSGIESTRLEMTTATNANEVFNQFYAKWFQLIALPSMSPDGPIEDLHFNDVPWPLLNQPKTLDEFPQVGSREIYGDFIGFMRHPEHRPHMTFGAKARLVSAYWDTDVFEKRVLRRVMEQDKDAVKEAYERLKPTVEDFEQIVDAMSVRVVKDCHSIWYYDSVQ